MRIAIKSNLSSYKNKVILLVCDGLGDRPYQPADGKTPLQAAYTPNLDAISEAGINGLIDIISPGIVPGSDTAHLSLFGYDPYRYYPGRGVFEALGADMELQKGDVAFRANFATVDANMRIKDRRAGRKGSKELAEVLNGLEIDGVKILLENTTDHRCAVVMRSNGGTLSRYVSDVDTHEAGGVIQKCEPLNEAAVDGEGGSDGEGARKTASIVNRFIKMSYELLDEHPVNAARREKGELPANIVLLRGAGSFKRVIPVKERFGFSAACIAGVSLYSGVAKYLGMNVLAHGYAGEMLDTDTDLQNKAEAALQALKEHDFVFVHVKDSDNYGHDGDFEGKKNIISRIDKELVARLKDADAYIAVTGDHSTPVSLKRHSSDPVPLVIKGDGVRKDNVKKFDEFSVAYGGLGRIKGTDLMPILSDFMGFYMMYGT